MNSLEDTIVALSTPAGSGAIAVIRLSGPLSFAIADQTFKGKQLGSAPSHTLHFGKITEQDEVIDEVVAGIFRGPNSYTGEDVLEVSCHGSPFIIQRLLALFTLKGARPAGPGEFTMRAFMNGKLDLSQAEAVADLVSSETAAAHKIALQQLKGGFSTELQHMRNELIRLASLLELELDFSEEDVEFANRHELLAILLNLQNEVKKMISSFNLGNVLKKGIPVAIAGMPNAGKSTLLNCLLNEDRAIVSPVAGTTRDTLEEQLILEGIPFRLIDTAGLRETNDEIESIGVSRAMEKMSHASLILYVFDPEVVHPFQIAAIAIQLRNDYPKTELILLGNKADQHEVSALEHKYALEPGIVWISARDRQNIDLLKNEMLRKVDLERLNSGETIITSARHLDSLAKTSLALEATLNLINQQQSSELLAFEIREALKHLGQITGEVSNDTLLDSIFSKFCIGK